MVEEEVTEEERQEEAEERGGRGGVRGCHKDRGGSEWRSERDGTAVKFDRYLGNRRQRREKIKNE